jgi:hypothetical protein
LAGIAQNGERRIVSSGLQLQDVILEALVRLQRELRGESPAAMDLWNAQTANSPATPKDEEQISWYVKRFLDRDLTRSGIIVNREVENRPLSINDLYVQCVDPETMDQLTVIIEVKGCWHRDLYSSMKDQLYTQYMEQQGVSHGIYLVAYFDGDRWEGTDRASRHRARQHSVVQLRNELDDHAAQLSNETYTVCSFVMDCTY